MSVVGFDVGNDASCVAIARKVRQPGGRCAVPSTDFELSSPAGSSRFESPHTFNSLIKRCECCWPPQLSAVGAAAVLLL
jgi:hypothetical protein